MKKPAAPRKTREAAKPKAAKAARQKKAAAPTGFYVYQLIDPRDGGAFYVGKGRGRRAWTHLQGGGEKHNQHKARRIAEIRSAGMEPRVIIIADGLSEVEALRMERDRILEARVSLTNIALGTREPRARGMRVLIEALRVRHNLKSKEEVITEGDIENGGRRITVKERLALLNVLHRQAAENVVMAAMQVGGGGRDAARR